jgi:hypothetical protein
MMSKEVVLPRHVVQQRVECAGRHTHGAGMKTGSIVVAVYHTDYISYSSLSCCFGRVVGAVDIAVPSQSQRGQ